MRRPRSRAPRSTRPIPPARGRRGAHARHQPDHQPGGLLHRPALLTRGKNPFDNNKSSSDFGANLGAGFRFALGQSGSTAVRLELEDYLYNGDFFGGNAFQNDLVASLGLSIPIGGHAGQKE